MTSEPRFLNPEEIGWLVRILRTSYGRTQETLAELPALHMCTAQPMQQGQPNSLDARHTGQFRKPLAPTRPVR
jgi:hypothetical protein